MSIFKFNNKVLTFLIVFLFAGMINNNLNAKPINSVKIVAIVNKHIITEQDLENRLKLISILTGSKYDEKLKPQVLQAMIQEYMQIDLGKVYGVEIPKEEIEQAKTRYERLKNFEKGYIDKQMKKMGIPDYIYDNQVKAEIVWESYLHGRFKEQIDVTDAEINSELELKKKLKDQTYYRLAEIVIPITKELKAEDAEKQGMYILELLRKGHPFQQLAVQFSKSPTARYGGEMGYIAYSQLSPILKEVVKNIKPGIVTKPIRVGDSYILYFMIDKVDGNPFLKNLGSVYSYATISLPIEKALDGVDLKSATNQDLEVAKERFRTITRDIKDKKSLDKFKKAFEKTNKKFIIKSFIDVSSEKINSELIRILDKLKKGQKSDIIVADGALTTVLLLDKATSKDPDIERKIIAANIRNKKMSDVSNRELRNLYKDSFIEIKNEPSPAGKKQ